MTLAMKNMLRRGTEVASHSSDVQPGGYPDVFDVECVPHDHLDHHREHVEKQEGSGEKPRHAPAGHELLPAETDDRGIHAEHTEHEVTDDQRTAEQRRPQIVAKAEQ